VKNKSKAAARKSIGNAKRIIKRLAAARQHQSSVSRAKQKLSVWHLTRIARVATAWRRKRKYGIDKISHIISLTLLRYHNGAHAFALLDNIAPSLPGAAFSKRASSIATSASSNTVT